MEKVGILGVGNILLKDEGFGVKLLYLLESRYDFPEGVRLIDGGTAGIFLSPEIEELDKLLIIDAVKAEGEAGEIRIYEKEDFFIDRLPLKLSPHQLGLQEVLLLNEIKGKCPSQIKLIGIIPKEVRTGTGLTPELEEKLPQVEELVIETLKEWGVFPTPKSAPQKPKIWWEA